MPTRASRVAMRSRKVSAGAKTTLVCMVRVPLERVPDRAVFLAEAPEPEAEALAARDGEGGRDRGGVAEPDVVSGSRRVGVGEVQLLAARVARGLRAGRRDQRLDVAVGERRGAMRRAAAGGPVVAVAAGGDDEALGARDGAHVGRDLVQPR